MGRPTKRLLVLWLAAVALLSLPPAAHAVSRCGTVVVTANSGDGFFDVRTRRVTCDRAARKLKRWARNGYEPRKGPRGYRCVVAKRYPEGNARVRCQSGARQISYDTGL